MRTSPARQRHAGHPGIIPARDAPPAPPRTIALVSPRPATGGLAPFHPATREWFTRAFPAPTAPQARGWPVIAGGAHALVFAPTGSGKTLAAFLWAIDRLMFAPLPPPRERCRVLYVSPLKALAADVERNLRAPLAGIANLARARGDAFVTPAIAVRTGDTPRDERARFQREPADILITTPESLFLLLTSRARDVLRSIRTVIVDEIHALVPAKRGAHLALSLERLEALCEAAPQRIGLSATQRPLDEVARFLGGAEPRNAGSPHARAKGRRAPADDAEQRLHDEFAEEPAATAWRPVTVVDARAPKRLDLRVEVPVEDMTRLGTPVDIPSGPAAQGPVRTSIWTSIHPRLLALVREHRSTLLFVNSRRLAERLAAALNELAGEPLVRAHHGSLARPQRVEIEDALKSGQLRALVATSSLELGIDMGAIDLVVQIEAPPSVASGLQRIGRGGHHVDATSAGVIFPKFRGDLVACAAVTEAMRDGRVESTRYPRNPLDVLAQQVVAMVAIEPWSVDALFGRVRCAAPFEGLSRRAFEGVLDMLSGRYPSDEFAELKPRLTWDRISGTLTTRQGAQRVAIANAGTIPDRGLYGVFLAGAARATARVGELDEEMVFESSVGETFLLGASTWRIEEITHDRVLVSPAPGEPGKMPFWKGDGPGRPYELGHAIGRLMRELRGLPRAAAVERLVTRHDLDALAAENLLQYLDDQATATRAVPDDRTIVVERCRDELGDWRVCVLSPFGGRVLTPWALAVVARVREEQGIDVEVMWTDDGFVVRFPETEKPPDPALVLPPAGEIEHLVVRQLGSSALFAAKFREVAGRALLLPRRRPGARAPLWQQRKRAADLLAVAARFGSFPALLETYRECLRDVFDMPALVDALRHVEARTVRVVTVDTQVPSPFASSLLFGYVANFLYDGDAPLAERRAQALSVDHAQLSELLGEAELRELLDPEVMQALAAQLQHTDPRYRARSADAIHDLLLRLGDVSRDELAARSEVPGLADVLVALERSRRIIRVPVAGEERVCAVEDAPRYRDAIGVPLPPGLPESLLQPVRDPLADLVLRYARTHLPFTADECAARFGLGRVAVEDVLKRLAASGRVVRGAFRPGGTHHEWCESGVLRTVRQRSLARLRQDVEPVDAEALGRLVVAWHGVARPRAGLDALLDAVEQLQGAPLAASVLEGEILPARVEGFLPADLDLLIAAGEVVWVGVEPIGDRDGRLALYLADHLQALLPPPPPPGATPTDVGGRIVAHLEASGASFFPAIHAACGGGYPQEVVDALWDLVWQGLVTNDALHALRAFVAPPARTRRERHRHPFRSRRAAPPAAQGRWSLVAERRGQPPAPTAWATAVARQLLARHGVLTRESVGIEALRGGFSAIYDVLKAMEEAGRIRRGFFVGGLGAAQFAQPAALDLLRSLRDEPSTPQTVHLAATDPANPYGALIAWPRGEAGREGRGPTRTAGATVILVNGWLSAYLARGGRTLSVYLPEAEPTRSLVARETAAQLHHLATVTGSEGMLIGDIDGTPVGEHPMLPFLLAAGFARGAMGVQAAPRREAARGRGSAAREDDASASLAQASRSVSRA
jgi:ATP-dependent helicase Lhr and Lhr-like helicase